METLGSLTKALRQSAAASESSSKLRLTDEQYSIGFEILAKDAERMTYQDFIVPEIYQLLTTLLKSNDNISVLEIGPGPKSVLAYVPSHMRKKITRYAAYEPNELFATELEHWLSPPSEIQSPLPCLLHPSKINRAPFKVEQSALAEPKSSAAEVGEKFNLVLLCHSMYGMKPKRAFIERALSMLVDQPQNGTVVAFHREEDFHLDGLVCSRVAAFPGVIHVADTDEVLDNLAPFLAGFVVGDADVDKNLRLEWRKVCRALGYCDEAYPNHLSFSSPNIMVALNKHATSLPELTKHVSFVKEGMAVKNFEARSHHPAAIVRPTEVQQVQQCVAWALKHGTNLTVVGGGHSSHCLQPNVVAVDMSAFDQVHILMEGSDLVSSHSGPLVIAGSGCKTGHLVRKTTMMGVTVPLGARPSVGAGLWLQGGIGHLARSHGLACDSIIGAVLVSVDSARVFYIGCVPSQHRIPGAIRAENDQELLWALRGAGTNFGIVISVTFKAYTAPIFMNRQWDIPLNDNLDAHRSLTAFDKRIASNLPQNCAADAFLYSDGERLHLGISMFESAITSQEFGGIVPTEDTIWGTQVESTVLDGVKLFDAEMYMSGMHGGHGGGKTSSFKRCIFLKDIGAAGVVERLVEAIESSPLPLCYIHLLHGGGAVSKAVPNDSAFGCRDWDFACVITGVWPRDQDNSATSLSAINWVYSVTERLLPSSCGVYSADLGPDPRDTALAIKAFGDNLPRLALLKTTFDPYNVLAYACPLPMSPRMQRLVILVTGDSGAGKDYCAEIWAQTLSHLRNGLRVRIVSISESIKREYAAAVGASLDFLLRNRAYKEEHRANLTKYYEEQLQQRPQLQEESFLSAVNLPLNSDVLIITGMREDAPVTTFAHLLSDIKIVEVHIQASETTRQNRRWGHTFEKDGNEDMNSGDIKGKSKLTPQSSRPDFIFDNDKTGDDSVKAFAVRYLGPLVHENVRRLAEMVTRRPNFPEPGIDFRHVLNICQQPRGMDLCTSLMQSQLSSWSNIDAVVGCEAGGFVFASALAFRVNKRLVLIREAGKLPPPTISVTKPKSFISSLASHDSRETRIEMARNVLDRRGSVVVVDDVLSTGNTACAILQLLTEAGIDQESISVLIVAEFPAHRGRQLLRERGFGRVGVQNILVFGGA